LPVADLSLPVATKFLVCMHPGPSSFRARTAGGA